MAELLTRIGGVTDVEVLQAAILHDTIEDTDTSRADLARHFGERVAALVMDVTDDKSLTKEERKRLQIEHARDLSRDAKLLKLADKISNVHDVGHSPPEPWSPERRREYLRWAGEVVDACRGANDALERCFDETLARSRESLSGD